MLKDFRSFVLRGNVVDLAVGVVLGAAFGSVITSLVENVFTPALGLLNAPDFSSAAVPAGESEIKYGLFLNAVVSFLLISAVVFLFVVRPVNALMERRNTGPEVESKTRNCPHCVSSIPVAASACAFCTRDVPAP